MVEIEEIARTWKPGEILLGLDHGTKTIGVAASDPLGSMAIPVETIRRTKFREDVKRLNELISDRNTIGLIVGFPINMDGSEGPRAQSVRAFVRNLESVIDFPIAFWDERLSTAAVERELIAADMRRDKRAAVIDAAAAAHILQGALDRIAALRNA